MPVECLGWVLGLVQVMEQEGPGLVLVVPGDVGRRGGSPCQMSQEKRGHCHCALWLQPVQGSAWPIVLSRRWAEMWRVTPALGFLLGFQWWVSADKSYGTKFWAHRLLLGWQNSGITEAGKELWDHQVQPLNGHHLVSWTRAHPVVSSTLPGTVTPPQSWAALPVLDILLD